jgi:hypothetical protein
MTDDERARRVANVRRWAARSLAPADLDDEDRSVCAGDLRALLAALDAAEARAAEAERALEVSHADGSLGRADIVAARAYRKGAAAGEARQAVVMRALDLVHDALGAEGEQRSEATLAERVRAIVRERDEALRQAAQDRAQCDAVTEEAGRLAEQLREAHEAQMPAEATLALVAQLRDREP